MKMKPLALLAYEAGFAVHRIASLAPAMTGNAGLQL
jgi:hypothetical protein